MSKVPYRMEKKTKDQLKFVVMSWSRSSRGKTDGCPLMQHSRHHCSVADFVLLKRYVNLK